MLKGNSATMLEASSMMDYEDILSKSIRLLMRYPLCNNCLGRLLGDLARGFSNYERGRALKIVVLMEVYRRYVEGLISKELLMNITSNIGHLASRSLAELGLPTSNMPSKCSICGYSILEEKLWDWAKRASEYIKKYNARSFLIGVRKGSFIEKREEEIAHEFGLRYYESIRNEVKREVGKKVQEITGIKPEFAKPDIVLVIDIEKDSIDVKLMPIYIKGWYWKLGRKISQSKWILWDGSKKYPLSVEEVLESIKNVVKARDIVLHASGREDVDVRMLGTGRPFIVELKEPMTYRLNLKALEEKANSSSRYIRFRFEGEAGRRDVRSIKVEKARRTKVYKALVVVEKSITEDELRGLEEYFKNRTIHQRTPKRVLHRRPDVERQRRVYEIRTRLLADKVFEALIECEGGLYVKELISGDNGRTRPSFTSYLGAKAVCVELDVVAVYQ